MMSDDQMSERRGGEEGIAPVPTHKRRMSAVGLAGESCSAEVLKLRRFGTSSKLFAEALKGPFERIVNPFGAPWSSRRVRNKFIPVMTSSCRKLLEGLASEPVSTLADTSSTDALSYARFLGKASSEYHYDETVIRLAPDMAKFRKLKSHHAALGLHRRFMGYTIANIDDGMLVPRNKEIPEESYLHFPEESRQREQRIRFHENSTLDSSGDIFDIRRPAVRQMLGQAIARAMVANDVDAVLIDYAVKPFAFGLPGLAGKLPQDWLIHFQDHQIELLRSIYLELRSAGKELFLNGMMLDSIVVTDPSLIRAYLKAADGVFWEQPFRWEWREYNDGQQDYYQRLEEFFQVAQDLKKRVIVKSGTYRFHATEDVSASWTSRFVGTDWGIEKHLAEYATCFFLLYYNRHRVHLMHTHPIEIFDIFASEAYFKIWDANLGEAVTPRLEVAKHVHMRGFENGIIFVNNRLEESAISNALRPTGYRGRLPQVTLPPLSGVFWEYRGARAKRVIGQAISYAKPRTRIQAALRWLANIRRDY